MANLKVLVIDDEEDILELIRHNLEGDGYEVLTASSGEQGLNLCCKRKPDLVVLDLMLPGMDGLDVCKQIRQDSHIKATPVIIVSAKGEEVDVVMGLELGADDYVTKPFSPRALGARIRNVLRRKSRPAGSDLKAFVRRGISMDPIALTAKIGGEPLDLTSTEIGMLLAMAHEPGRVFTRKQLIQAVRGGGYAVSDRSVDVQILSLRRKLGAQSAAIEAVRGVGYRFSES